MDWRIAMGATVAAGLAMAVALPARATDIKQYGGVTVLHLMAELPNPQRFSNLHNVTPKDFTYALYPTAADGTRGNVPGDTVRGTPLMLPVHGGTYDHHLDPMPVEFDITNSTLATRLEHAPGNIELLVFGVLYTGEHSANCTGVVDVIEMTRGQLVLEDQVSYDCRGGGDATFDNGNHKLTVDSARYAAGDNPCCPATFDTVELRLNGANVKASDVASIDDNGGE